MKSNLKTSIYCKIRLVVYMVQDELRNKKYLTPLKIEPILRSQILSFFTFLHDRIFRYAFEANSPIIEGLAAAQVVWHCGFTEGCQVTRPRVT